jgi:hypothetical protein
MNLLRQLDSKPSERSGSSRSEQAHQLPGPSTAAPNVDPLVDLPNMTFVQALPRITQLAQNQKVIAHYAKYVAQTRGCIPRFILPNRSRKSKTSSKERYWKEREGIEKAQFTRVNQARTRYAFRARVTDKTNRQKFVLSERTSSAA